MNTLAHVAGALATSMALLSCGGTSGSSTGSSGGPPGDAYAKDESVQVSGVTGFVTDAQAVWHTGPGGLFQLSPGASVYVDGELVPASDPVIHLGETVQLSGTATAAAIAKYNDLVTASRAEIDHILDGPIDSVDPPHCRLVVMGMAVEIRPGTYFDLDGTERNFENSTIDLSELKAGDRVTVSGNVSLSGLVIASRIARSTRADDLVTAFVTAVDVNQRQISIGGLKIDYSGAQLTGFGGADPQPGQRVRAVGVSAATTLTLAASSVALLQTIVPGSAGDRVSVQGLLTKLVSPTQMEVDGMTVSETSPAVDCGTAPVANSLVQLDGTRQGDGTILVPCVVAQSDWGSFDIGGPITAVDTEYGTLTIMGYQVQPTMATLYAHDFKVGDSALAYGGRGAVDGVMLATSIGDDTYPVPGETVGADTPKVLLAAPFVYILGRPIRVTSDTTYDGFGVMTMQDFFTKPLPQRDLICTPHLDLDVTAETDGSLTTTRIHNDIGGDC